MTAGTTWEECKLRCLCHVLLLMLLGFPSFSQTQNQPQKSKSARAYEQQTDAVGRTTENGKGIEVLKRAEAEAAALNVEMRGWALWQIGMAYQSSDRVKALELFEEALTAARTIGEEGSRGKVKPDTLAWVTGRPSLPPKLRLESDIARSIILLEPKRADHVLEQVDAGARSTVLLSVLASQEKKKQFNEALETLERVAAQDEMPYEIAMRLIDTLKPEQSGELLQLFSAALVSYRDHAPHLQFKDDFPPMLGRYWKRLPKAIVRQAIDEILKQAPDASEKGSYSVQSGKETTTFGSLLEYRLYQIMPALREFDPAAAREYVEKYPALASSGSSNAAPLPSTTGDAKFHPSGGYNTLMMSMAETPSAEKAAARADAGDPDEAMSEASGITDSNLRAQTYEYIARIASQKGKSVAANAIGDMLNAAEQLQPREALRYYGSAAELYMQMGQTEDAKKSVEAGLQVARKLYQADSDEDDPNTALKAFWPSTNAYCSMLRQAAHVSHAWAMSLLPDIRDSEIKVVAEIALAGGWLNSPIGPSTIMTEKKNSHSISFGPRD